MAARMPMPSKFGSNRKQRVLAILGAGGSRREAARAAGISPTTLANWLHRGEQQRHPEGMWRRFLEDVRAAESGQRLVGLELDHPDSVGWALGVLEREGGEWAASRPAAEPEPARPVVIKVTFSGEDDPA